MAFKLLSECGLEDGLVVEDVLSGSSPQEVDISSAVHSGSRTGLRSPGGRKRHSLEVGGRSRGKLCPLAEYRGIPVEILSGGDSIAEQWYHPQDDRENDQTNMQRLGTSLENMADGRML